MFNRLEVKLETNTLVRCKNCKAALFNHQLISEFISYDQNDLGKLEAYSSEKISKDELNYFVLKDQFKMFTSFKINYKQSFKINYHPFYLMNVFLIQCQKCHQQLGYQVDTVNQNTAWMEDKFLIDTSKCSVISQDKDTMERIVRVLNKRLVRKLEIAKQQENQQQKQKQQAKQQQVLIEKFQNAKLTSKLPLTPKSHISRKTNFIKKQIPQSTKSQSNFLSRHQNNLTFNSNIQSNNLRSQDFSLGRQFQSRLNHVSMVPSIFDQTMVTNKDCDERTVHNENVNNKYKSFKLTKQQRQKMKISLSIWRQRIQKEGKEVELNHVIESIFDSLSKINTFQEYTFKRIPTQVKDRNIALTMGRKISLKNINKKN